MAWMKAKRSCSWSPSAREPKEIVGGMALIELSDVTKRYRVGDQEIFALNGVDLSIGQGEYAAIIGPSGSGKSTLMHLLGCLDMPDVRDHGNRWHRCLAGQQQPARRNAESQDRLRLPGLQSARQIHGAAKRGAADDLQRGGRAGTPAARAGSDRARRPFQPGKEYAAPAFRRPDAARCHRARSGESARKSSSPTNRPATWTARPARTSCSSSASSAKAAAPSSSSRTTAALRP